MTPIRALVLDYGNVLTEPQKPASVEAMASLIGVPVEAFRTAYWAPRRGYDAGEFRGLEYWAKVLRLLGRPETGANRALIQRLVECDTESWFQYREEVWDLALAVRARGVRTAILTNSPLEIAERMRAERRFATSFDAVVVSAEERCTKPDRRIYEVCLARLGVPPADSLFVDDRADNVEGAAQVGMQTLHFAGEHPLADLRVALLRR